MVAKNAIPSRLPIGGEAQKHAAGGTTVQHQSPPYNQIPALAWASVPE
jgi:hypothetical protein